MPFADVNCQAPWPIAASDTARQFIVEKHLCNSLGVEGDEVVLVRPREPPDKLANHNTITSASEGDNVVEREAAIVLMSFPDQLEVA